MDERDTSLLARVEAIAAEVGRGRIGRARPWGGADVVITATKPLPHPGPSFYPDPQFVVTPHARELSWLFGKLGSAFADTIDYLSKYEFYGRLAGAADRAAGAGSATELLHAVLAEARVLAREFATDPDTLGEVDPPPGRHAAPPSYTDLAPGELPEATFRQWWQNGRLPQGSVLARLTDEATVVTVYPDGIEPDPAPVARFVRHVLCVSPAGQETPELWGVLIPSANAGGT